MGGRHKRAVGQGAAGRWGRSEDAALAALRRSCAGWDELSERLQGGNPLTHPWCLHTTDSALAGGTPWSGWFASLRYALEYLRYVYPNIYEEDEEDDGRIAYDAQAAAAIAMLAADKGNMSARLRIAMTELLEWGDVQSVWVGSFDELCRGQDDFSHEVRDEFWSRYVADEVGDGDVPASLRAEFAAHLTESSVLTYL